VTDWPTERLGDVVFLFGGGTPSKQEETFWGGRIPWASVRDLRARWLDETEFKITGPALNSSASRIIPAGNVVICTRVGLGKVVQVKQDTAINQDLKGLIPKDPGRLCPDFIYYWYLTVANHVVSMGTGATVQGVKVDTVANLRIPLPPLDEQKRIVAKLDEAQRQIDQLTGNLDLQLAAVGYFERAAVNEQIEKGKLTGGGLRSSDLDISSTTEPAVKALQRAPLGTVARIDYGTRVTRKKDGGSKFPVYGGGGATFSLDQSNRESCFIVSRFAMSEECVRYVEGKFFLNDSGLTVSALDETLLTQSYLDHFLLARSIDIFGLGKGTAQRNLDMGAFRSIQIPLPPLDEQKRVVALLGALQQELAALRGRLDKRRSLALSFRDRALAAAFAGDV
jgi:type I restriction enzyme S subunit